MDPDNYQRSIEHFADYPAGDLKVHYLLACLWAQVASIGAKKPASYLDIAPWLDKKTKHMTPGQRRMQENVRKQILPRLRQSRGGTT